jgi:hypothetical protein
LKVLVLKLDFEKSYDRVDWEFLEEVLVKKGFHPIWIGWVMQYVKDGHLPININGEKGAYFGTSRGVRQGDPLSPLLFDYVVEALAVVVEEAKNSGHLTGPVPHLISGGVSLLQYADNTVVLLECSDSNILHLKFLLYCFENMSCMKINYHKSEVYVVRCEIYEQERVAHMLNYKLGQLPIVYLEMPIGESRLCNDLLILLVGKILKRMDPWQGKLMSLTTRLTLSNACLANIVMFQLGFYLFGE